MTIRELVEIIRMCDVPQEIDILPAHKLREDLLMTSFSMMLLIIHLEEKIGHVVDLSLFVDVVTVNDLYELLTQETSK